ncbi:DUF2939 domain-containing protein [Lysobacter rhizosphaerae]
MKKWLILVVVIFLAIAGWIAAGPFLTIHAIRGAIQEQNAAKLSQYVDFPALRASLRQQVDDYVVRRAGPDMQANLFGAVALQLASGATDGIVDALATPAGLAAVMEGRNFWYYRLSGQRRDADSHASTAPRDPLEGARYAFESPSRFTATVKNADGAPVVFVLARRGFSWRVTEVILPLAIEATPTDGS